MKAGNIIATLVFIAVFVYILIADKSFKHSLQKATLAMLSPLGKISHSVKKNMNDDEQKFTYQELLAQNKVLHQQVTNLSINFQDYEMIKNENDVLRSKMGFARRDKLQLVPAEVILRNTSTWWESVYINKGSVHGLQYGDPVLTENGLVGKVISAREEISRVILITDERCKVSSMVSDTKETGILNGKVNSEGNRVLLSLNYLSQNARLRKGQIVATQGVATFPAKIKIGTIIDFKKVEVNTVATVEPSVNFKDLSIVFVAIKEGKNKPSEISASEVENEN